MFRCIIVAVHVGCILARNFELPNGWPNSNDDEVATNIDDYGAIDDPDIDDDESRIQGGDNSTSQSGTNALQFIRELKNITRNSGETVKLTCEVRTDPLLVEIRWFKNDAPILIKRKSRISIKDSIGKQKLSLISRLRIMNLEVHDSGFYKCTAANNYMAKSSTGVLIVKPNQWNQNPVSQDLPDFEPSIPNFQTILKSSNINLFNKNFNSNNNMGVETGLPNNNIGPIYPYPICEPYRGEYCEKYLGSKNVFIPANASQTIIESKIADAFKVITHSNDLSKSCEMFAIPTLCYFALPVCKPLKIPTPEFICQEDCKMLEDDLCRKEYAIAKRHSLIGKKFALSDCSVLPTFDCKHLGIPLPEPPNKDEHCYRGDGSKYRGDVSETESGNKCIAWNLAQTITIDTPELLGGHNYCRNPGQVRKRPWCYTSINNIKNEESCNIPECDDINIQNVLIGICGLATLLLFLICYVCCSRRRSQRRKREQMISNKFKMSPGKTNIIKVKPGGDCNVGSSKLEMSSLIPTSTNSSQKSERRHPKVFEFDFNVIKFEEELGEGAFGKVYKGEVITPNGERMMVAIKTLKDNANSKTVGEFKREVELMSELRHPNIISLLGVCMANRLCMLFEFMSCGDLHEYLIAHSPSQDVPRNHSEAVLEQEDLLNISIQIAAGMEYLCNQHFVHRDLATRNCLVGQNLLVKISDFGLSRDVYSSDYYRVQKSALLPIRWMSPESILYGKFTVESDIWSFGVVLWEIYSYGLQPYYAHSNHDVVDMIRSHQVLPSPEGCPPRMYALMIECWNQVPSRRPQFGEIHSRLLQWRDTCSSSDKTDSTQLSHHIPHRVHHHHHGYPASVTGVMIK